MSNQQKTAEQIVNRLNLRAEELDLEETYELIDSRNSQGYIEPFVKMTSPYGEFFGWVENGVSLQDVKWSNDLDKIR